MSNLIVLILLPVHGRRKSARRVGFPFVTALSSLPGNTLHSNHNLIVNPGIVGEPVMPIALLAFSVMQVYHISLDLDNEQRPFSDLADIFVLTHPPSLTHQRTFCVRPRPRRDLKSATSGQITAGLLLMGLMCQQCFMQHGRATTVCPANPKGIVPNTSQRWVFLDLSPLSVPKQPVGTADLI